MRRETISQALDLLGERHIAYVTDKKPRAAMHTTSLSEARPAPEPGVLRRIINTAAVIVFAVGVIIGFILMRQSIGPGTTPGDSLTETDTNVSDTENNAETDAETDDTTDTKEIVELQNENYIYYVENETVTITRYIGTDPEVTIPDKIDGYPVTRIAPRQIYDENGIEDSVTATFGDEYTNVPVTKVIIPDSVVAIENYVFKDANSLKEVVFGEGITEIPSGALKNNKSLYEVTLPKSLDRLGLGVFSNSLRIIHYPYSSYNWKALLGRSDTNYWITQATIISSVDQLEENSDDLIVICYNERLTSAEFWSDPDNLVNENIDDDFYKMIAECYLIANYPGETFEVVNSTFHAVRMCNNDITYNAGNTDLTARIYYQMFVASDGEKYNVATVYQTGGYIFSVKECTAAYGKDDVVDIINNDPRTHHKYFLARSEVREEIVCEYSIYLRHKDDTGPEHKSDLKVLNVTVTQYRDENGELYNDLEVYPYFDSLIFEVKDCDYAFDAAKIFEKAKEYDVPLMFEDRPVEEFVLADHQYFTSVWPDEFSSIDLFSIDGIEEIVDEIGMKVNDPFTPMITFYPSKINQSTEKTLYFFCIITASTVDTIYGNGEEKVYVEFAVDRKTMSATVIAKYSEDEYYALYPSLWIYNKNCVAVENDDYKVFYDDRGDLLMTDKKTGKTTVVCDILSYVDYEEYCAGEGVTDEESRKFLFQGIENVSIWNGRYIFFNLIERLEPDHWMVYDIAKGEYMSTNYGEIAGVSDDRMFVAFEGENELGLDPGIYYVDYTDSYGKFKYVRIDSFSDIYVDHGDGNRQFLQYRCSNDGRFLVMCVDARPWIDPVYEDIYVIDLKKNKLSKYYFCFESGRSVSISDENELIVTQGLYRFVTKDFSYPGLKIHILDLDD